MKRNLFIINIICVFFVFLWFDNVKIDAFEDSIYVTSDGTKFSLEDVLMYDTDFIDKRFDTEIEFIDYIYEVGYNRTVVCYEQYEVLGHKLTVAEIKLFALNLDYIDEVVSDSCKAISTTASVFGYNTDDTKANAFQHAYWVMLMYFHTSPKFAIEEAYAHEEYDGNEQFSKHMDLYNDDIAYEKAKTISYTTDDTLVNYAKELVDSGKLIYIKRNYRYLKEKIYHTTTGKVEMIYDTADFYCYTNSNIPFGVPETKVTRINYEIMQGSLMEV